MLMPILPMSSYNIPCAPFQGLEKIKVLVTRIPASLTCT